MANFVSMSTDGYQLQNLDVNIENLDNVLCVDASGNIIGSGITCEELNYLSGLHSNIATSFSTLNNKVTYIQQNGVYCLQDYILSNPIFVSTAYEGTYDDTSVDTFTCWMQDDDGNSVIGYFDFNDARKYLNEYNTYESSIRYFGSKILYRKVWKKQ